MTLFNPGNPAANKTGNYFRVATSLGFTTNGQIGSGLLPDVLDQFHRSRPPKQVASIYRVTYPPGTFVAGSGLTELEYFLHRHDSKTLLTADYVGQTFQRPREVAFGARWNNEGVANSPTWRLVYLVEGDNEQSDLGGAVGKLALLGRSVDATQFPDVICIVSGDLVITGDYNPLDTMTFDIIVDGGKVLVDNPITVAPWYAGVPAELL